MVDYDLHIQSIFSSPVNCSDLSSSKVVMFYYPLVKTTGSICFISIELSALYFERAAW